MNAAVRNLELTPEDWRILRALSLYRLLLVILLLVLLESGIGLDLFSALDMHWFHTSCIVYALAALTLLLPVLYRNPGIAEQAPIHFFVDVIAIANLAYASGGIAGGLGILLLTPAIGTSLVLGTRPALWQPVMATLLLFGEEVAVVYKHGGSFNLAGLTLIGLMLLVTCWAGNTVGQRARRGEALAARVGSDLESLARLNQSIIASLQTGVLIADGADRLRPLNDAALRLTGLVAHSDEALATAFPALDAALRAWRSNPHRDPEPLFPPAGTPELVPRLMRIGEGASTTTLILLDETSKLREQAQAMKVAALGRLSASIAHEIRNPLTAIHQASQLLSESPAFTTEEHRLLDMIQRHTGRIDKIIRDVLSLTRNEVAAVPASLALRSWLMQAIELYSEGSPTRGASLRLEHAAADAWVRFDPSQLQQILFNLWDNSFDHGKRPVVELRVVVRSGTIGPTRQPFIEITDNGGGIPLEVRDKVFEPFFTTARQGSGLGLYLARELCEYNQARLEYLVKPAGACFRVIFAGVAE